MADINLTITDVSFIYQNIVNSGSNIDDTTTSLTKVYSSIKTQALVDNNTALITAETTRATTAVALLAPLISPTFSGIPIAPKATTGTNTTQVASTAFVQSALSTTSGITYSQARRLALIF